MAPNSLDKVLLSAVDESLSSLGDSSKQAIFFHLENTFQIKKENIPASLTEFTNALEGIFGSGATYLEQLIAKNLCRKLGIRLEDAERLDLAKFLEQVQRRMVHDR
ncbi:MAG: hypothetical protein QHH24_02790 [Candidatus Bathyarchaeota archaeon]|nr:hypothetical protein [Candidatus Bathyarchaeota archaeon]